MERKLKKLKEYRNFCKFDKKVPSHDSISWFKRRRKPKTWKKIQEALDKQLEELGVFEEDELCGDGTDIPLPENVKIATYGAKSDRKIFLGIWLMTINSTKTGLVRDFNIGTAEIGQIVLMEDLLNDISINTEDHNDLSLDGIFDTYGIRETALRKLGLTPVIPYNPRNSGIKKAEDLPPENWRWVFTPFIGNKEKFKERFKPRTSSERENGRLKQWTTIGKLKEKAKRAYKITTRYILNQTIISIIRTQITALAYRIRQLKHPVPTQMFLVNYF